MIPLTFPARPVPVPPEDVTIPSRFKVRRLTITDEWVTAKKYKTLPLIGRGASRQVYLLPDKRHVLKVADGDWQVATEQQRYIKAKAEGTAHWLTPILAGGPLWTIMPRVRYTANTLQRNYYEDMVGTTIYHLWQELAEVIRIEQPGGFIGLENYYNFGVTDDGYVQVFDYGF